ncbi:MAG: glycoside hydrolase family 43 protein [Woeseiaceae bacterium]|nr:glycoside hydrolase family 43 protein [Woeseiaceae bacterium]
MLPRILFAVLIVFTLPVDAESRGAETFSNPIIPGFAPDPSIVRVGEDFYLINSTFEYFPGIPIYHSRDLINWELIGYALHDEEQVDLDTLSSGSGIHASTIRYHDGLFYIITTNNIDGELVNFVVTAEDPKGPWSDAIVIEGAPGIDPSLLFDDDGRVWYTGNHVPPDPAFNGEMEIWLQELDSETLQLKGERYFLWRGCCQGAYAEGPHIYKKDGFYYLLISEGGTAFEHAMSVAISEDITGPYLNNPRNPVLSHRQLTYDHPITGVGHADIVELADGRWYAVALGWRLVDGRHGILGRETFLLPMTWETEPYWWKEPKYTWPVFSPETGRVELRFPTPFADTSQRDSLVPFEDDFDGDELGLEWNMRRTHDAPFHALEDGSLRLDLQPGHLDDHGRYSFLGVRQRHFEYLAQTEMRFEPRSDGEEAGVAVMQNDRSAILFTRTRVGGEDRLRVYRSFHGEVEEIASAEYGDDLVHLRVGGDYLDLDFSYSADGQTWTTIAEDVDGTTLSPAVIHGFNYTGLYLGVFASSNGNETGNRADYGYFRYTPRVASRDAWYHRQIGRAD